MEGVFIIDVFSLTPVGRTEAEAKELIKRVFPTLSDFIVYELKGFIPEEALLIGEQQGGIVDGAYESLTQTIYLAKFCSLKTALHEIGHAVHHQLFHELNLCLPTEGQSERAKFNYHEDFAEAFADLILNFDPEKEVSKRDRVIYYLIDAALEEEYQYHGISTI